MFLGENGSFYTRNDIFGRNTRDKPTDGPTKGPTVKPKDGGSDRRTDGGTDGRTDGKTDGWTDGGTDGRINWQTDHQTDTTSFIDAWLYLKTKFLDINHNCSEKFFFLWNKFELNSYLFSLQIMIPWEKDWHHNLQQRMPVLKRESIRSFAFTTHSLTLFSLSLSLSLDAYTSCCLDHYWSWIKLVSKY